jgi:hypothetical protein
MDHAVLLWDLEFLGAEKSGDPSLYSGCGGPELVFVHLGHTGPVRQATWCPFMPNRHDWTVASVCDNNVLQLWSPSERALNDHADGSDDSD